MPIYEYKCSGCDSVTEQLQRLSDPPPNACPACKAPSTMRKLVSAGAFCLKGTGWAKDNYGIKSNGVGSSNAGAD